MLVLAFPILLLAGPSVDDTPGQEDEWGFRPLDPKVTQQNPPSFSWRPQEGALRYELQVSRMHTFDPLAYSSDEISLSVHCPPVVFEPGRYFWRFRYHNGEDWSDWSKVRRFLISGKVREDPFPGKEELLGRIPTGHPRLFLRPEAVPGLRERITGTLAESFAGLVAGCEALLADPPPSAEPELYSPDMERGSDDWKNRWWGNREYTQAALGGAARLAFVYLLNGDKRCAELSRKLLMDCADWDPAGSTNYAYNDEAAMPYAYYFARTYTFLYDYLSEAEREKCQAVLRERGRQMYEHLTETTQHLWKPYGSHNNRAWHFLGEVGVALHGDVPEADEWIWYALNVYANVYPVWSDDDGGWHEGAAYWASYIDRFTWWADVMREAFGIDAYEEPYFSKAGDFAMYAMPPVTRSSGFGDMTPNRTSHRNQPIMSTLAVQAANPYWLWYANQLDPIPSEPDYISFLRDAMPKFAAKAPADLPTSRLFEGVGQAMLNSNLLDASDNVGVLFKSSPFGTASHGYESQNSFLLYAYGERLFIRSGKRDFYGSDHHRNWMWQTKSVNNILVNGQGQYFHTKGHGGEITRFKTTDKFDWVVGEAGDCYPGGILTRFTRRILFYKPEVVVIQDILEAPEASTFSWLLHSPEEMQFVGDSGGKTLEASHNEAACRVEFLWPQELEISQTDQFDPPPLPRIQLVEHHLTANTVVPAARQQFVTILRPHRKGEAVDGESRIIETPVGFGLAIPVKDGELKVMFGEGVNAFVSDGSELPLYSFQSK